MKKIFILLVALLLLNETNGQVLNPGFEIMDSSGLAKNWAPRNFLLFGIDSTCLHLGADSINFVTGEAHNGSHAIEVRNESFCGAVYSGLMKQVRFQADTFADQRVPFTARPAAFTFFYKLFPVGGDGGRVNITLETESGDAVANADMVITGTTSAYQQAVIPLTYHLTDAVAYINIIFSLSNANGLHYGSRFLIDDLNQTTTAVGGLTKMDDIKYYPVPVKEVLNLVSDEWKQATATCRITDAIGNTLMTKTLNFKDGQAAFSTEALSTGIYFLTLVREGKVFSTRFIK